MSGDLISRSDLDEYAKQCINRMKKDHDKMMNTDEKIKHRRFFKMSEDNIFALEELLKLHGEFVDLATRLGELVLNEYQIRE